MTQTATPEQWAELWKPLPAEQVKWKVQTNPKEGKEQALVVAYIDARDVAERLDMVFPGGWSDEYVDPVFVSDNPSLECRLTIAGVTRRDVGEVDKNGWSLKDLYSDAFKRAGVKFGIGAFLYRFPVVFAKVDQFGKSCTITQAALQDLESLVDIVMNGAEKKSLPNLWIPSMANAKPQQPVRQTNQRQR